MHPRNVNYIYLFFSPQICQYIYDTLGETTKYAQHIRTYTCIDYYRCVCVCVCLHVCNVNGMQAHPRAHWRPCCWRLSTHRHERTVCGRCCIAATGISELGSDGSWRDHDQGMTGWRRIQISLFFSDGNWIQGMFSLFFFSSWASWDPISIHKILLFARIVGNQWEFDCFLMVVGWYSHRCWVCDSHHLIIFPSFWMILSFFPRVLPVLRFHPPFSPLLASELRRWPYSATWRKGGKGKTVILVNFGWFLVLDFDELGWTLVGFGHCFRMFRCQASRFWALSEHAAQATGSGSAACGILPIETQAPIGWDDVNHLGLSENVGYIPNEIAIFHRDNDH